MKKYFQSNSGFTLLELLVVIGIIGILVALATVSYSAAQKQGRDSRRKQDVVAIQNALEQYYSANGYKYPTGACSQALSYIQGTWPKDPDGSDYINSASGCAADAYCVCAKMERASGGNTGSTSIISTGCTWNGGITYYCVGNLQ